MLTSGSPLSRDRLGGFIAVMLGTAVVALTLSLLASAAPRQPDRFAAVTMALQNTQPATAADPFPPPRPWSSAQADVLAGRLTSVAGVAAAIPDHRLYAQPLIDGRPVADIQEGHGWASARLAPDPLTAGHAAVADGDVVIGKDLGIAVGGRVNVLTASGTVQWTVVGLIDAPRLYVSDVAAARLAPGVQTIGLLGKPDLAAVHQIAGNAQVLSGRSLGDLEPREDARTRWIGMQVLTAMAALAVFASIFVIASTAAFSVSHRRREIGLLRAIGATPRQVRRSVLREAALLGGTAALAGTALGGLLAPVIGDVLVGAGFEPAGYAVSWRVWPILAGLAAGPVVSVAGAYTAARRAARVGPMEALRSATVETRPMTRLRWVAGLVFSGLGAAAGVRTATTDDLTDTATYALLGAMALVCAATLLAPAVVPPLVRILLWPARGPLAMLARESALAGARRTASTAAPVLLTVAFAVFIAGNVQTSAGAYASRRADAVRAGSMLVPDGTPGLSDAVSSTAPLRTTVYLDGEAVSVAGVDPDAIATSTPRLADVTRRLMGSQTAACSMPTQPSAANCTTATDTVVLTQSRANRMGVRPDAGGVITAQFADGLTVSLRVVGVTPEGSAPADLLLARSTVRAHDPSALADAVQMKDDGGQSSRPGARTVTVATYARQADAADDRLVWIFTLLLIGVSVGYGAVAVANTLLMATAGRAADFRQLRLAGATPRQVLLTVAAESVLVVVIGALLGSAAALLALWGTTRGLTAQTGLPVGLTIPWPTAGIAVLTCLALAVTASVLPARSRLERISDATV